FLLALPPPPPPPTLFPYTTLFRSAFDTNFGQPFLNGNERALGAYMDRAVTAGSSAGIGRLLALLGNIQAGGEAQYRAIFDQLNPDRKSTRLNSSHVEISYAVFCLK